MQIAIRRSAFIHVSRVYTQKRCHAVAIAAAALVGAQMPAFAGQEAPISPGQRYQLALEAQTARDYPTMLAHLRRAAEDGERQAQVTLTMVLLAGPTLYGNAVSVDRCEALHWARKAAMAGSALAQEQLIFLSRLKTAPSGQDVCAHVVRD